MTTPFRNPLDTGWFRATIKGNPMSKANSRRLVYFGGKPRFVKSKKALEYLENFQLQCPHRQPLFDGDVVFGAKIFYKNRRPDLDESLILDALQGFVYENDRQVKSKVVLWGHDKENPRCHIIVAPLTETEEVFRSLIEEHNVHGL